MTPRCISAVCLVPASCEMQSVKNNKSSFRKAEFDYLMFLLGDAGGLFLLKIDPFRTKTAAKVCSMLLMMKQTFVNTGGFCFGGRGRPLTCVTALWGADLFHVHMWKSL